MDDEAKTGPFKPTVLSEDGLRSGARQAKAVTGEYGKYPWDHYEYLPLLG